jgi:UDP-GlcNAc:undecaprenyl-phosphate GlcNAc-1-phosphate transferase
MVLSFILAGFAGLAVSLVAMIALRPVAVAIDLVDRPGGRKTHHGEVPIVGGLAMLLGLVVGMALLPTLAAPSKLFVAACALLVVLGLLDDRFELSPYARLITHAAIISAVAVGSGATVHSIGDPFGAGEVLFPGTWAYVATLIFVAGAVNAFNMLDGMDGLAGALALVALGAFIWLGVVDDNFDVVGLSFLVFGTVIGFLLFNVPAQFNRSVRCFMGDGGSTLLGFILAYQSVLVSQGTARIVSPVVVLWFAAMPIYEVLWTIIRRASRGRSPLSADREHMHHLLLDGGFGVRAAFIVLVSMGIVLATTGLALHFVEAPDYVSFGAFICCGIAVVRFMYLAPKYMARLPANLQRLAGSAIGGLLPESTGRTDPTT